MPNILRSPTRHETQEAGEDYLINLTQAASNRASFPAVEPQDSSSMSETPNYMNVPYNVQMGVNEIQAVWKQKLPTFMSDAPDAWFILVEAQFTASRITSDDTKYLAVLRAVDADTLRQLTDVIRRPPAKDKFEYLKNVILNRLLESRARQVDRLLKNLALADKKPSQLLREMQDLAKGEVGHGILHQLWLERLPAHIHPHLLISSSMGLDGLAEMSDRLMDVFSSSYVMATTTNAHQETHAKRLEQRLSDMQALIVNCMQEIKELKLNSENSSTRGFEVCRGLFALWRNQEAGGKLGTLSSIKATDGSKINQVDLENRLHVRDKKTGQKFLIDSGSVISIVPVGRFKKTLPATNLILYAANSTQISTYGTQTLNLDLDLRRCFKWLFVIADVPTAIISADFLCYFDLSIDLKYGRLIDSNTKLTSRGEILRANTINLSTIDSTLPYADLLAQYVEITKPNGKHILKESTFAHHINTKGAPVFERFRKIFGEKAKAAKAEIANLLDAGILQPSRSPWASPIHVVPKKDGSYRLYGDYRRLNAITVPDRYAPPLIQDIFPMLHGKTIFSSLDLEKAYYQIPITKEDVPKTAINTPWGLYEYLVMPFGLKNATQTFQRYIDHLFRGLDFTFVYVDDILIMSENETQHRNHLKAVFEILKESCLSINLSKFKLRKSEIDFLGFRINKNGYSPAIDRVEKILNFPRPENVMELRRFLGMLNYYRRSIPDAAFHQAPLNDYLKSSKKNDKTPIVWNKVSEEAYERCKRELRMTSDASTTAIGAVLEQKKDDMWHPIGFFSRKLSPTERRYSTYDRELLAMFAAVKHFEYLVEGRHFVIRTDHKPLIHAFQQKHTKLSDRQLRQTEYISQFSTHIQHVNGDENMVADTSSRIDSIQMPTPLSATIIQRAQEEDEELKHLIENLTSLNLQKLTTEPGIEIYCHVSEDRVKPYLIKEFAVLRDKKVFHILFSPPFPYSWLNEAEIKQANWLYYNHHGLNWTDGYSPYYRYKDVIRKYVINEEEQQEIFVKGLEKRNWLSGICDYTISNADECEWGDFKLKDSKDKLELSVCMNHEGLCVLKNVYFMKYMYEKEM
ncbi:uncharacterized protein [Prorops nasuta]|uniref:uncharacterized protein n=1 Tax=Prorops nasuta TaxID=863751 RepID=UPI0034CF3FDD